MLYFRLKLKGFCFVCGVHWIILVWVTGDGSQRLWVFADLGTNLMLRVWGDMLGCNVCVLCVAAALCVCIWYPPFLSHFVVHCFFHSMIST